MYDRNWEKYIDNGMLTVYCSGTVEVISSMASDFSFNMAMSLILPACSHTAAIKSVVSKFPLLPATDPSVTLEVGGGGGEDGQGRLADGSSELTASSITSAWMEQKMYSVLAK